MYPSDLAAMAAHAVISVVGGAAGTATSTFVQERLRRSDRGRAALDGLTAAPGDPEAQREVRAALAEAIDGDAEFADRLAVMLHAPVNNATGSVVISGSDVKGSQITLGPLTVNRTPAGRATLALGAALLAVLIALGAYGGVTVITDGDSGDGYAPRALTAAETKEVLPNLQSLPPGWEERNAPASQRDSPCHVGASEYVQRPYEGATTVEAEFNVAACRSVKVAADAYTEESETFKASNEATSVSFPSAADQAVALRHTNFDLDETVVTVLARQGTVVCWLGLEPVNDLEDHMAVVEELMGVCTDRAREVQTGS